jgi:hypothetical protein
LINCLFISFIFRSIIWISGLHFLVSQLIITIFWIFANN